MSGGNNEKKFDFFDLQIKYLDGQNSANVDFQHIHNECELYINMSGDVSFMVENTIYAISAGDAIITKPYENHHCILNTNANHRHFWLLFKCSKDDSFFDLFFNRKSGECNLLKFDPQSIGRIQRLCRSLLQAENGCTQTAFDFLSLIDCLKTGTVIRRGNACSDTEIMVAAEYINKNPEKNISVSDMAKKACMSISTFERHFKAEIGISPREYLTNKRLSLACMKLDSGLSVQEVCDSCGFSDCSHFIVLFKKKFGVTPYKYKMGK